MGHSCVLIMTPRVLYLSRNNLFAGSVVIMTRPQTMWGRVQVWTTSATLNAQRRTNDKLWPSEVGRKAKNSAPLNCMNSLE
jgi:hypothetical protein